tara:strand:+ start:13795 stop:14127 length:333 start_codon:yes stop_codon:yes gene_type:complete
MENVNVDVEIYFSKLKTFFKENPQDLRNLIGEIPSDDFFIKVYRKIYHNSENGEDLELTQRQIMGIILEIKGIGFKPEDKTHKVSDNNVQDSDFVSRLFKKTKYGLFGLN